MVFFFLLGCFFFGAGLDCSFLMSGLGCLGCLLNLGWAFFPLDSLPGCGWSFYFCNDKCFTISLRYCDLFDPYLDWILISLQRLNFSVLTIPKSCPNVSKLKGISLVLEFWRNLSRIHPPKSFGNPAINLYFQKSCMPSFLLRNLLEAHPCTTYSR